MIAWIVYADGDIDEVDIDLQRIITKSDTLDFVESGDYMKMFDFAGLTKKVIDQYGESLVLWVNGSAHEIKGIVNERLQPFERKHYDASRTRDVPLGHYEDTAKMVLLPYEPLVEQFHAENIFVDYRGERYVVMADSFAAVADTPVYTWLIIEKVSRVESSDYYDHVG